MKYIEIMAPVGSYESLMAAINAGANSVYFGIDKLNMRARAANNFSIEDLRKIVSICQENKVKTYLTLNIVMYDQDLSLMKEICDVAKEVGVSSIIATDMAVINYANSIKLKVHISTQANVSNIEAVKFFSKFAEVIVLARELTIEQIRDICKEVEEQDIRGPSGNLVEIEVFVHGALCVAISGKCYMSLHTYNTSANRGNCLQNCRRKYKVTDEETGKELVIDNNYVMSPRDLCTIEYLEEIVKARVKVLKIEGRGRAPEYVHTVVKNYREAIDLIKEDKYTEEKKKELLNNLKSVYNRGFWDGGYYFGKKTDSWSNSYGSQSEKVKSCIGNVENYYDKIKVGYFNLTGNVKVGDTILIIGPTTGVVEEKVIEIKIEDKKVDSAVKGDKVTIPISFKIRKNDQLYLYENR